MDFFEQIKQILHYKKIEAFVKKNKKNDIRTGILFVAGATILESLTGFFTIALNMFMADILPETAEVNYVDALAELGFDTTTLMIVLVVSAIVAFIASIIGLTATHRVAEALGGKAKMGEYFYIGGKFMFIVALAYFVLELFNAFPCLGCLTGIVTIAFLFYSLYLFILLVSSLYKLDIFKSLIGIATGYLVAAIFSFGILSALGAVTGLPLGLEMLEQIMDYYQNVDFSSYEVPQ